MGHKLEQSFLRQTRHKTLPNRTLQMKKIRRLYKQKLKYKRTEDLKWVHKREQCICSPFISSNIFQTENNLDMILYKQKIETS